MAFFVVLDTWTAGGVRAGAGWVPSSMGEMRASLQCRTDER